MSKIGIDFGTSFCTASWINPRTKLPEAITFHETGKQKMPSIVHYAANGNVVAGEAAYNLLEDSGRITDEGERNAIFSSTITSIKRKMEPNGCYYIHDRRVTHQTVIKDILLKIKKEAEKACFYDTIDEVVITHPVVFEEWKKEMLRSSALEAGFKKVELYFEPVSAAIGFMESTGNNSSGLLVYDFGGGTFDVAYVKRGKDGSYHVPVLPEGDPYCGGDDIDDILYNEWDKLAQREHKRGITSNIHARDIAFLSRCRKQKENMSSSINELPQQSFNEILPPPGFQRIKMTFDKTQFEKIMSPVIENTIGKTQLLLNKIRAEGLPLDTAIMIGGSSRIPMIKERLSQILYPLKPQDVMAVDVAVALGAVSCGIQSIAKPQSHSIANQKHCYCSKCGEKIKRSFKRCCYCGKDNAMYMK